jgi:hypothetical protein
MAEVRENARRAAECAANGYLTVIGPDAQIGMI